MSEVTQILMAIEQGDPGAPEELLPLVYAELRRLAAGKLSREQPGQTLQATALVHEAWLRLVESPERRWNGQRHFFLAAAEAMRRILIENARRKRRPKHGGHLNRVDVAEVQVACPMPEDQLLAVDEALDRLAQLNPLAAQVVKLRFFAGLTEEQAAQQLEMSVTTLRRIWTFARAWLFQEIRRDQGPSAGLNENGAENRI
jgi:RNA polymerase sigma factor (TIGR02999 family)